MRSPEGEQQPLALEQAAWDATAHGQAVAFYDRLLTANARVFLEDKQFDRRQALADWAPALAFREYRLSGETVVPVTGDLAHLTYQATVTGDQGDCRVHCSSLYVRRDGRWLLTLHQRRPLRAPGPDS
ncbi:nuclear transport factor 2 family protein [Amycolatopsis acidicola]|uniref:nuclear transport factor 2 family protein n=1 Tax=Amycolatopsis acidicola TaxID=2596893 RepID=UPI00140B946F|nr:nuclear transport factor 2 family protein [Amycolatopsis acidicola]